MFTAVFFAAAIAQDDDFDPIPDEKTGKDLTDSYYEDIDEYYNDDNKGDVDVGNDDDLYGYDWCVEQYDHDECYEYYYGDEVDKENDKDEQTPPEDENTPQDDNENPPQDENVPQDPVEGTAEPQEEGQEDDSYLAYEEEHEGDDSYLDYYDNDDDKSRDMGNRRLMVSPPSSEVVSAGQLGLSSSQSLVVKAGAFAGVCGLVYMAFRQVQSKPQSSYILVK